MPSSRRPCLTPLTCGATLITEIALPSPHISVVMPVRNGGRFLAAAVDSVLAQQGADFEVLCIDDGSTDETPQVLAAFAARDPRLSVHRGPGRGISRALNHGLALARGRYIARMDADDLALPGRLAAQFAYLERHPDIGVLGTQAETMDENGAPIGRMRVPVGPARVAAALSISAPFIHPSVMMRRELVLAVGGYRPAFDGAEDYDLWLRLSERTALDNLPQSFLRYRRHSGQQSVRIAFRQARLAALAQVFARLRRASGVDPLEGMTDLRRWRFALDGAGATEVRLLTASRLADNGGSLSAHGGNYFRRASRMAATAAAPELRRRMALACVRHQLQLLRGARWREMVLALPVDVLRWRLALFAAYGRHAGILWRSRAVRPGA